MELKNVSAFLSCFLIYSFEPLNKRPFWSINIFNYHISKKYRNILKILNCTYVFHTALPHNISSKLRILFCPLDYFSSYIKALRKQRTFFFFFSFLSQKNLTYICNFIISQNSTGSSALWDKFCIEKWLLTRKNVRLRVCV